jgi:hypothetical protein
MKGPKFVQIERQIDFVGYPHGFLVPDHTFHSPFESKECLKFWAGVEWCEDHLGRENCGALYYSGTWTISSPQKPRIFFRSPHDAFAFKMRWC